MHKILESLSLRGVNLCNRMGLAPMTMYCSEDGTLTDWHYVHYASRSQGTGLVLVEATAVSESGKVTPHDLGLWDDKFILPLKRLTDFIHNQNAVAGIQLSHGGRKASRTRPWDGDIWIKPEDNGWETFAPTALAFSAGYPIPKELNVDEIQEIKADFKMAARRALEAGFKLIEIHAGHGRLFHSFYSNLSNRRSDMYGGSFENRIRLLVEVVETIRNEWPEEMPLMVRLSCVDWIDGGWSINDTIKLSTVLKSKGVDIIDCSSGGIERPITKTVYPGYQVPFAAQIKKETGILTAAVGLISDAHQAADIIESNSADLILFGRKMLVNPQFPLYIANKLKPHSIFNPLQYQRAFRSVEQQQREFIPEL
ncbi:NADH:flavin oxidoreductase/NADH oxidase [Paenibacillus sp. NPDC058177]|uniref:NADH:flavin oxidoreductase/NADH oxidase n=1 Tax=Paenibacillus sp. NPDC058177 TaxID=3346369 RepID=UPI0036DF759E